MPLRPSLSVAVLLALGAAVCGSMPAHAQDGRDAPRPESPPRGEDRGHRNSMSDSVRRVRNETGGQVLSVERMQYDGRDVTRVKYIDDRGRVRTRDMGPQRRDADAPVRPRGEMAPPQPPRGDNPPRP